MKQYSLNLVGNIICEIIDKGWQYFQQRQFVRKNITKFSAVKTLDLIDQTQKQQNRSYQQINTQQLQNQPSPLIIDSLLPISADIDENTKNKDKLNQTSRVSKFVNNSVLRLSRNNSNLQGQKKKKQSQYQSLGFILEEQQAIYKELRKQHQDQLAKEQAQKLKKIKQTEVVKGQKKGRDQKVSFDYNGQIVKLRLQNRNNLIGGGVNGLTSNNVVKIQEKKKKYPPTKIQYEIKNKQISKQKKNDVFFNQTVSLFSDAIATKGIKLKEGNLTIQEKERIIPARQLKNTLSTRRLSKNQFRRLKQLTGNIQNFQITNSNRQKSIPSLQQQSRKDKKQTQQKLSPYRSASESKISIYNKKSSITINDPQLLDNLINGPVNQAQQRTRRQQTENQDQNRQKLNTVDSYNLQYIKKGPVAMSKNIKSSADLGLTLRLPKIQASYRRSVPIPRPRQKIKQQLEEKLKI